MQNAISKREEKEEAAGNSPLLLCVYLMRKGICGQGLFRFQSPSLGYCSLDDEPDTGVWLSRIGHDRACQ